jgi:hypothetical protein
MPSVRNLCFLQSPERDTGIHHMGLLDRLFGSTNIEKLKRQRDIVGRVKALQHRNVQVRQSVALALGELRANGGFSHSDSRAALSSSPVQSATMRPRRCSRRSRRPVLDAPLVDICQFEFPCGPWFSNT